MEYHSKMHKSYAWHYMQIKVFVGSKFWIPGILLLPFIEIWDVKTLPPYKRSRPEIEKKVRY